MKIVCDDRIPFLKGVFEPYAEVQYLPGSRTGAAAVKDADALMGLTRGEKKQIWEAWRDESNAALGESAPSSDS